MSDDIRAKHYDVLVSYKREDDAVPSALLARAAHRRKLVELQARLKVV